MVAIVLAFVAFMASVALAADVVRIDEPTDNAQLPSNTEISFKYTVIGAQAGMHNDERAFGCTCIEFGSQGFNWVITI